MQGRKGNQMRRRRRRRRRRMRQIKGKRWSKGKKKGRVGGRE